jgi:hypothetical protein
MKKILSLFIAFAAICFAATDFPALAEESRTDANAAVLTDALFKGVAFDGGAVTRGRFVEVLINSLNYGGILRDRDYYFTDVSGDNKYKNAVYAACEIGWVAQGTAFRPEDIITYEEAVKLCVCALGYRVKAENSGGYPTGYLLRGADSGLLSGISVSGDFGRESAYRLFYNTLNARPLLENIISQDSPSYQTTVSTLLEITRGIKKINGIVSATPYNTLDGQPPFKGFISINGEKIKTDTEISFDSLGIKHEAYVHYDKDSGDAELVCLWKKYVSGISFRAANFIAKEGNTLRYLQDRDADRASSAALAGNVTVIYNGRRVFGSVSDYLGNAAAVVRIYCNSGNTAETVYVDSPGFVKVRAIDILNNVIRDEKGGENAVFLDGSDVTAVIKNANGRYIDYTELMAGDYLRVYQSEDGLFIRVEQFLPRVITGFINIDSEAKWACIGDEDDLLVSDYLKNNYYEYISEKNSYSFTVTEDGIIVSVDFVESGFKYAYLIKVGQKANISGLPAIKMFTQDGKMLIAEIAANVYIDGEKKSGREALNMFTVVLNGGSPRLVKYKLNAGNELYSVNFAYTGDISTLLRSGINDDRLFSYYNSSFWYWGNDAGVFGAAVHARNAVIFVIPTDLDNDEDYRIGAMSVFEFNKNTPLEVYDIDESGGAHALVYNFNMKEQKVGRDRTPALVDKLATTTDSNGDEVYAVYLWMQGQYRRYIMRKDLKAMDDPGNYKTMGSVNGEDTVVTGIPFNSPQDELGGGSIIHFYTDAPGEEILNYNIVFNANKGSFTNVDKVYFNDAQNRLQKPMFYSGKVYNVAGGFISVNNSYDAGSGGYNFVLSNLRFINIGNPLVVQYNCDTGAVRPVETNDIRSYLSDGNNAHYAVVCQRDAVTNLIVVYEKEELRR